MARTARTPEAVGEPVLHHARLGGYDGPDLADLNAVMTYAKMMAGASIAPDSYRGQPANIVMLLQHAKSFDLPVGVCLGHLHFAAENGRAGMSGQLLSAVLRRADVDWTIVESTDLTCTLKFTWRRKRIKNPVVTFSIDDARALGVTDRPHWRRDPKINLYYRCLALAGRLNFSEVLVGFSYTREEVRDMRSGTAPADGDRREDDIVAPEVTELVEQARSVDATSDLIRTDIMARARRANLLTESAGGGRTLERVLLDMWRRKRHDEDLAATAARADAAVDGMDTPPRPCTCDPDRYIASGGRHEEGCDADGP